MLAEPQIFQTPWGEVDHKHPLSLEPFQITRNVFPGDSFQQEEPQGGKEAPGPLLARGGDPSTHRCVSSQTNILPRGKNPRRCFGHRLLLPFYKPCGPRKTTKMQQWQCSGVIDVLHDVTCMLFVFLLFVVLLPPPEIGVVAL